MKDYRIKVSTTPSEREQLEREAKERGLSLSSYLREQGLKGINR